MRENVKKQLIEQRICKTQKRKGDKDLNQRFQSLKNKDLRAWGDSGLEKLNSKKPFFKSWREQRR